MQAQQDALQISETMPGTRRRRLLLLFSPEPSAPGKPEKLLQKQTLPSRTPAQMPGPVDVEMLSSASSQDLRRQCPVPNHFAAILDRELMLC